MEDRANDLPSKDRDIAMVFQNYALYPHLTVYDNMAFGLQLRKVPKQEIDERVREAARILDLEPYLKRKPKALSGGQRQRVALGRAIVRNAQIFLMDEPLSNLDAKLRVQMRAEISKLHQRLQTTIIYVTHDLLPLSLVLLTTFKTTPELYSNPIGLPAGWNIENYKQLLVNEPIFGYIKNSVIVTVFSTFFILWFSSMIAYAIIQLPQKLGWIVYGFFVCGMIVPTQVNMIPVFLLMNKLGLVNTLTGVIIVSISFLLPIGVFIITGFMKTLPKELFEAARIDGASEWKIYSKIALRLSIPSMATVGIFSFVIVWNDLLFPLLLLKSKEVKTLPIALLDFQGEFLTNYPMLFSAVVLSSIPLLIAYVFLQKHFISGMTSGALK